MNTLTPRADNMTFLDVQGSSPYASPELGLEFALVTAGAPMFDKTEQLLEGGETPSGRNIPGIHEYRGCLEQQGIRIVLDAAGMTGLDVPKPPNTEKLRVIMGIQGSPHDATNDNIERLHSAGLRVMGIGYESAAHPFGSGFSDRLRRLTASGREYLNNLANQKMMLDLSHSGHQTALDALEYIRDNQLALPVFASHTGLLEASSGHPRNFPLEVLEGIQELGGIVGIYALTFALHESDNTLEPMMNHIDAAVELLGADTVAIGTDGIYQEFSEAERHRQFEMMSRMLSPTIFQARFPAEPNELNSPRKMDVLAEALKSRGYELDEIAGIIGLNTIKFYQRALA